MSKKVVLGFSGGLDTTYCVKYLTDEKGYEVHSIVVNTGGFSEDELKKIREVLYQIATIEYDEFKNKSREDSSNLHEGIHR